MFSYVQISTISVFELCTFEATLDRSSSSIADISMHLSSFGHTE